MLLNSILLLFLLHEFHVAYILLLVAVVASDGAVCLVDYVEDGLHRFVVSDALWVVAFHDSADLVGCGYCFLLHHLVVADYVEHNVWCYDGET